MSVAVVFQMHDAVIAHITHEGVLRHLGCGGSRRKYRARARSSKPTEWDFIPSRHVLDWGSRTNRLLSSYRYAVPPARTPHCCHAGIISARHCLSLSGGWGVAEKPRDVPCAYIFPHRSSILLLTMAFLFFYISDFTFIISGATWWICLATRTYAELGLLWPRFTLRAVDRRASSNKPAML